MGWQVLYYIRPLHLWAGDPLWYFFSISPLLGIRRYSILILYFPCHHPGIRHHPNKLWFLFIREWYLETKVCLLLLRHHCFHAPSPNREVENYTHTHLNKKSKTNWFKWTFILEVFDLQKNCKDSTAGSHILCTQFWLIFFLTINEPTRMHYY